MEVLDFKRFLKTLSHTKFLAFIMLLLSIVSGYYYSYKYNKPMYESKSILVLAQDIDKNYQNPEDSYITGADVILNKNLISTYRSLATSDKVLDKVISNLNLNMSTKNLADSITLKSANNTEVINISVVNENNKLAQLITNELVDVFCDEIESIYNMSNIHVMDYAEVSDIPYNINHIKDFIVFFILGIILYLLSVFFIYLLDNTVKSENDLENFAKLNVLTNIPLYNKTQNINNELIVFTDPKSPITEAFKACRTNIMFANSTKTSNIILITSASPNDGKSFISSNLALAYAQSGKKVLLIDTDMRNGRIHELFSLRKKTGLSGCLGKLYQGKTDVNINKYIKETKYKNLHVMTTGINPSNPSELLASPFMKLLLYTLNTKYDVIICDGTPCTLVSDSIILAKIVDYTILVTSCKSTKLDTVKKVKKSIEIAGGKIDGAILNKEEIAKKAYKNKYYHNALPKNTSITEEIVLEHDETLDTPLYLITKTDEIYEDDLYVVLESPKNSTDNTSNQYVENFNKLINSKFYDFEISSNRIVENLNIKINNLNKNHEFSMKAIDNIKEQLDTLAYSSMSLHEKINIQQEEFNEKLDEQLEESQKCDNKLDEKINYIIQSVNDSSLEEKLDDTVYSQEEQLEQIKQLQDSICLIKDTYENKLYEQQKFLVSLEEKITELINNYNKNNLVIYSKLNDIQYQNKNILEIQNNLNYNTTQINSIKESLNNYITIAQNHNKVFDDEPIIEDVITNSQVLDNEPVIEDVITNSQVFDNEPVIEDDITNSQVLDDEPVIEDDITNSQVFDDEPVIEDIITNSQVFDDEPVIEDVITNSQVLDDEPVIEDVITNSQVLDDEPVIENVITNSQVLDDEPVIETENTNPKTYDNKNVESKPRIVKRGFFSFINRKQKIKISDEELEEDCEPVSQILSIG